MTYHKKDVLGLDIGTSSVKYAQLKESGKLTKLVGYGRVDIPKDIIIEGVISEPEKLAELLKKSLADPPWGKITAKRIIASLPESKIFTRILDLPALGGKDVNEAINYEVEQSIPVSPTDLYIDWQVIEEDEKKITVFLSAAPKAIVDSYIQLFRLLEMEPLALEMSLAAIARSMVSNKGGVEPVIILDLGGETSNMAVFDTNLKVTEALPIGGTTIKNEIETVGLSDKEATKMIRDGLKGESQATEVISKELTELAMEVKKIINYYTEKNEGGKISKLLLCGGLAFLPGLVDFMKEKTGLEAKIGNPWVNISIYPLKPVPKDQAPGYAAAIGLCLRGLYD